MAKLKTVDCHHTRAPSARSVGTSGMDRKDGGTRRRTVRPELVPACACSRHRADYLG